ncbi:MAG: hypothetical protein A2W25_09135 [candidate division Zixibacteria bacterium RBG_16_53_22]|nr:MAG: hypothetical protein A2W25_09135 [candidate division Zixibacteria bacterium RBG_16_53_22]
MRKYRLILVCFAISGLFFSTAGAADKGFIAGRVVWQDDGGAIADAEIAIQSPVGSATFVTNTDEQGIFRIELPAGRYIVSAEKQNLIKEYYPDEYFFKEADPIDLFGGEARNIVIALDLGGWISGNFSYIGEDIDYALLTAIKIDEPYAGWHKSQSLDGPFPSAYAVTGLIPGTYKILGRGRGKSTEYYPGVLQIEDAAPISVPEAVGIGNISFVLDQVGQGSIQGRAYNVATGEGICGAKALFYQWQNYREDPALDSVVSAADGTFFIDLPAGGYYIMLLYSQYFGSGDPIAMYYFSHYDQSQAEIVNVAEGQQVAGINFPIDYTTPHDLTISGVVIGELSGAGLNDITVTAIDYDTGEILGSACSYNDGEFIINGLCPRRYLLMFSSTYIVPFFFSRAQSWQDADVITLDRDFGGVRTEAITQDYGDNGLAIVGRVSGQGLPIEGARIYAYPLGQIDPIAYAVSDVYGDYSIIGGLAPGQYTIMCDMYGYDKEIYPLPVQIDLITDPVADDINFELIPTMTSVTNDLLPQARMEPAGNYPNPFNSQTIIRFYSGRDRAYSGVISVYNLLGQIVGQKEITIMPGPNRIFWDMPAFESPVSSGIYCYKVDGANGVGRMILLK